MMIGFRTLSAVLAIGITASASALTPFLGGQIVVGDHSKGIYRLDAVTGSLIENMTGVSPWDISYDNDAMIVADKGQARVVLFDARTGAFLREIVSPGTGGLVAPYGARLGQDGNLYVGDYASGKVRRFDFTSGLYLGEFAGYGGSPVARLEFDDFGGLLTSHPNATPVNGFGQVIRANSAGQVVQVLQVSPPVQAFDEPWAMSIGAGDMLYVSSENSDRDDTVVKFDLSTGEYRGVLIDGLKSAPFGLVHGPNGDLFVGLSEGKILRYDGLTGAYLGQFADLNPLGVGSLRSLAFVPAVPEPGTLILIAAPVVLTLRRRAGLRNNDFVDG